MAQPMTTLAKSLDDLLEAIGWSRRHLAHRLDVDQKQVQRWATGEAAIPPGLLQWLEVYAAFHCGHPPPRATSRIHRARQSNALNAEYPDSIPADRCEYFFRERFDDAALLTEGYQNWCMEHIGYLPRLSGGGENWQFHFQTTGDLAMFRIYFGHRRIE